MSAACLRESAHGQTRVHDQRRRSPPARADRTARPASTPSPTRSPSRNSGDITAQLIARHWIITDANGHVEEVRGLAVVGQQPVLKPGETFEYTSWTRIATPQRHDARHLLLHDRGRAAVRRADRRVRPDARLRAALAADSRTAAAVADGAASSIVPIAAPVAVPVESRLMKMPLWTVALPVVAIALVGIAASGRPGAALAASARRR